MFTTISRKCQLFSYNFPFFLSNYCDITIQFIYISNQIHRFEKCNKSKEAIFRGTPGFLRILRFLLNVTHPRRNSRNSSKDLTFLQISAVSVLRSPSFSFSSCFQFVSLFLLSLPLLHPPPPPPFRWPVKRKKSGTNERTTSCRRRRTPTLNERNFCRAHVLHFYTHARSLLHILFFLSVARDNRLPLEDFFHETLLPPSTRLFFPLSSLLLPFFSSNSLPFSPFFFSSRGYVCVCALARTKRG